MADTCPAAEHSAIVNSVYLYKADGSRVKGNDEQYFLKAVPNWNFTGLLSFSYTNVTFGQVIALAGDYYTYFPGFLTRGVVPDPIAYGKTEADRRYRFEDAVKCLTTDAGRYMALISKVLKGERDLAYGLDLRGKGDEVQVAYKTGEGMPTTSQFILALGQNYATISAYGSCSSGRLSLTLYTGRTSITLGNWPKFVTKLATRWLWPKLRRRIRPLAIKRKSC
jgi:hypothetical protein